MIPLHEEVEDIMYVMDKEEVISLGDVASVSPVPSPNTIFKCDSSSGSLCQLSQNVQSSCHTLGNKLVFFSSEAFTAPHRLKNVAGGKQVVMVPLLLSTDDTSGNKSKQWNKFDLWSMKLAGLPCKENSKLENIHLISCSNKCAVLDMSQPIVDDLLDLELHGITAFDCHLKEEVLVVAPLMCVLCDNPRHAEIMNHSGPSANLFCRMCMVS